MAQRQHITPQIQARHCNFVARGVHFRRIRVKDKSLTGRVLAIGDIHGCSQALESLLKEVAPGLEDTVVVLGDFIDKGPDTRRVVAQLLNLSNVCNLVCLRGNHEIMFLQGLDSKKSYLEWLSFGGEATLASYGVSNISELPQEHIELISKTKPYHEEGHYFFTHSKTYADLWLADVVIARKLFTDYFNTPPPSTVNVDRQIICGHIQQEEGKPHVFSDHICIDTAVVNRAGWLTCLDVVSNDYWQSNEKGMIRKSRL